MSVDDEKEKVLSLELAATVALCARLDEELALRLGWRRPEPTARGLVRSRDFPGVFKKTFCFDR